MIAGRIQEAPTFFSTQPSRVDNVWTTIGSGNTADSSTPYASFVDFSQTATPTSIVAPAGTSVASQLGGVLVESNGGLTYQQAITVAVPEPGTWALGLMGVALLLTAVRKQRSAALRVLR